MPLGLAQQPLVNGLPLHSKDTATLAVPYLYSGYFLLANTILYQRLNLPFPGADEIASLYEGKAEPIRALLQSAMDSNSTTVHGALSAPEWLITKLKLNGKNAPEGDFKAGQVPFMLGDARACGDLARKANDGGFTFDAVPLGPYTDQVQYIGLNENLAKEKLEDARAFITMLLSEEMQQKITSLGALPARALESAPTYADTLLQSFYEASKKPLVEGLN
jgi:ABC-type glycerol-3-phosphate transport system substrate-binding protein